MRRLDRGELVKVLLIAICSIFSTLLTPTAWSQTAAAKVRYGNYPIQGAGLKILKRDFVRDEKLVLASSNRCRSRVNAKRLAYCDLDHDKISNRFERRLGTNLVSSDTDHDGLRDRAELLRHHTNPLVADTDNDGISDGDEVKKNHSDPSDPNSPVDSTCTVPSFNDQGDTVGFAIPSNLTGNITRGQTAYTQRCSICHSGIEKGTNFLFPALKTRLSQAPMFITTIADPSLADLVAYLNRTQTTTTVRCAAPTPSPTATAPIDQPTATPVVTPTPTVISCGNQYFDSSGNTTGFGIPSPLVGNLSQGESMYNLACTSCHGERGTNFDFATLKAAVTGPKMNISSITDQQYAHLAAYLNRSFAPTNCATPVATPTPADDRTSGRLIYQVTCSGCHSRPSEFRSLTTRGLQEAIREKPEMRNISLTSEQIRVLLVYFRSL